MDFAKRHFGELWPQHVESLITLLCKLRMAFDGDLDSALILALIGGSALPQHRLPKDLSYAAFLQSPDKEDYQVPLNTLSIAEVTGIPRETARRKLAVMEARGWVARDNKGHWKVGPHGADDLRHMTDFSLEYLSALAETVQQVSRSGGRS